MSKKHKDEASTKLPDHTIVPAHSEVSLNTYNTEPPDNTHLRAYNNVHLSTYDTEFISQINKKMQVPDRISVADFSGKENRFVQQDRPSSAQFSKMTVPDKIILSVEERHRRINKAGVNPYKSETCESNSSPQYLEANSHHQLVSDNGQEENTDHVQHTPKRHGHHPGTSRAPAKGLSYVELVSPPRAQSHERFSVDEETDDHKMLAVHGGGPGTSRITGNSHLAGPGRNLDMNLNDPAMLHEEYEIRDLRAQVARLTRRVLDVEQDNQRRANKEFLIYPLILGYFLWKLLGWLTRS